MFAQRHTVSITTDASGDFTGYTAEPVTGRILHCIYDKPSSGGLDTATFAITGEVTGINIWSEASVNADKMISPRTPTHDYQAAASLYAAAGEPVEGHICLANERIKVVVSSAGDTKTGTIHFIVG